MSFSALQVLSMSSMFRAAEKGHVAWGLCATAYVGTGIAIWNTGSLNDVSHMFEGASVFDEDISPWNTAGELKTDSNESERPRVVFPMQRRILIEY